MTSDTLVLVSAPLPSESLTEVTPEFQIRYAHPTSPGCHQLHMVIVAKLQEPSRSAFLCSVVIFVKYREVSTRTTLPNFIGNWRDSIVFAFWQSIGKREKEEAYVKEAHVRQVLSCFNSTPLENYSGWPGELSWLARGIELKQLRTCLTCASLTCFLFLSFAYASAKS